MSNRFDLANQLTSITGATGATTSYMYDGSGLRASATTGTGAGASVEQFTWAAVGSVPLLLTDASHAYVYGVGSAPLAQVALVGGHTDYMHTDLLGSVRTTTDTAGAVTSDADYDTYGVPRAIGGVASSAVTRFGYAGEYTDPTGLIYLRARYYDPVSAQFLSRDPLETRTRSPYGYTGGNPLQFVDPTGLWGLPWNWTGDEWATVGQVAGIVGAVVGVAALTVATGGAAAVVLSVTATALTTVSIGSYAEAAVYDCAYNASSPECAGRVVDTAIAAVSAVGATSTLGTAWGSAHVDQLSRMAARVEWALYAGLGSFGHSENVDRASCTS